MPVNPPSTACVAVTVYSDGVPKTDSSFKRSAGHFDCFSWPCEADYSQAFVELFVPTSDWRALHARLQALDDVSYYAGNHEGEFVSSDADAVNAVTWGTFPGKE